MLSEARPYLYVQPGLVLAPAVLVVGVALVVVLLGRALERRWMDQVIAR